MFGLIADVAVDPRASGLVYAAMGDGVYRSTNGGSTFSLSGAGVDPTPNQIVVAPTLPTSTLYAPSDELWGRRTIAVRGASTSGSFAPWTRVCPGRASIRGAPRHPCSIWRSTRRTRALCTSPRPRA